MVQGWDEFHVAACGDLDPLSPGLEVLLAGHASEIVMLGQP